MYLVKRVSKLIPPLSYNLHKGSSGRITVVGGCKLYTGAPYYAGSSCLKIGSDLTYVICSKHAEIMKTYSPELMISPLMEERNEKLVLDETFQKEVDQLLERTHTLVVGPGLGRDEEMFNQTLYVVEAAKQKNKGLVIDGDGLFLITQKPESIHGYEDCVLTPNAPEFSRLRDKILKDASFDTEEAELMKLCECLGYVTIVKKGMIDLICNGHDLIKCEIDSPSPRRCGGQGDILSGACGTFLTWSNLFTAKQQKENEKELSSSSNILMGMYGACLLTKSAAKKGFESLGRGVTTPDIIKLIPQTFTELFPEKSVIEEQEKEENK